MNENVNRQDAELNEAALSGVSGGVTGSQARRSASDVARNLCVTCYRMNHSKEDCRKEHMSELADYLLKNGTASVHTPADCPCYND